MATILIVDDSPVERLLATELLKASGDWTVIESDGGEIAWTRLQIHPVDVVLTDLQMPGGNGLELLKRAKQRYPLLPVVVMTGKGSEETAIEALQNGADGYITKRQLTRDVVPTIERVLEKSKRQFDQAALIQLMGSQQTDFLLDNNRRRVPVLIGWILSACREFNTFGEHEQVRVGVALEEALLNAMIHGNLEVSSRLREEEGDAFEKLIRLRLHLERFATRRVYVRVRIDAAECRTVIRDEGPGFDVANLPDPTDPEHIGLCSGRGILMMRAFMDLIEYNARGNEVTLVKRSPAVVESPREGVPQLAPLVLAD